MEFQIYTLVSFADISVVQYIQSEVILGTGFSSSQLVFFYFELAY